MCIIQIIVAPHRRKQIQQYMLSGERLIHIKDYSIPEPAQTMVKAKSIYTYCDQIS